MANTESGRFVAEIPGLGDVYADLTYGHGADHRTLSDAVRSFVEREVRDRVKSDSLNPEPLSISVSQEIIKDGQPVRKFCCNVSATPYPRRLTDAEYGEKRAELLARVPPAFYPVVREHADNDSSLEEQLDRMRTITSMLSQSLIEYERGKQIEQTKTMRKKASR